MLKAVIQFFEALLKLTFRNYFQNGGRSLLNVQNRVEMLALRFFVSKLLLSPISALEIARSRMELDQANMGDDRSTTIPFLAKKSRIILLLCADALSCNKDHIPCLLDKPDHLVDHYMQRSFRRVSAIF